MNQQEAIEIRKEIDPAGAVQWVIRNWWWISFVGEKIYKFLIKLINGSNKRSKTEANDTAG